MDEETTRNLCDKIDEKVDAYASGDLKHAVDTVSLLWEVSKKGKGQVPTSPAQSTKTSVRPT